MRRRLRPAAAPEGTIPARRIEETTMARRKTFVWAATLALLAGCATHWDVDSYAAPDGDVTARHTFYFKGGDFGSPVSIDQAVVTTAAWAAIRGRSAAGARARARASTAAI